MSYGFHRSHADHSVFVRRRSSGIVVMIVYVYDIILSGNDSTGIEELKQYLKDHFQTKDLGQLRYFLGIELARARRGISLSQRKYVIDFLLETRMLGAKPVDTPMDPNIQLLVDQGELFGDPGR